jgi:hypothetical protein
MNALNFRCFRLLLALMCLFPGLAPAEEVRGLYEGQVEVISEEVEQRIAAQGRALRQVIGKISGRSDVGGIIVDAAVAQPQRYLQQFSYRQGSAPESVLTLWVSFDVAAVDALMVEAQLPVWSGQRPSVLVWLAVATSDSIELLAAESGASNEPVLAALRQRAWQRGIPITYPLLDLEDHVRIKAADIWQLDMDKISAASLRYGSGVVLVGRVEASGSGAWSARWSMIESGQVSQWTTEGLSAAAATPAALDLVADRLSSRYAIVAGAGDINGGGRIDVTIMGVRSLKDYARAMDYLYGLDQVSALVVRASRSNELRLGMQVRGGSEGLRQVAAFSDVLSAQSGAEQDGVLSFRLLP